MENKITLSGRSHVFVKQVFELGEMFGFETRNKYEIKDDRQVLLGYAAEQQKGILGFIFRQYLGHWRTFDVHFFDAFREPWLVAHHPFRWFFQRIEIEDMNGKYLGAIQKRFSFLTKRFDVEDSTGRVIMQVASPIWRIWTFSFIRFGLEVACVKKRWSGAIYELFTDRDNFLVEFKASALVEQERTLVLVAAIFIDLLYFERKAD